MERTLKETLLVERSGAVEIITLNRPERFNAFNEAMKRELNDALREASRDPDVRCLVLRGAGDKAFCSGGDQKERVRRGRRHACQDRSGRPRPSGMRSRR